MEIIDNNSSMYPSCFKQIYKPPKKIYTVGNVDLLYKNNISIVGTRHPTNYGIRNCKKFAKQLSKLNTNIVSGMAIGIDTVAHKSCLENGGSTIAVLPCGLNNIYPKQNIELFNNIVDSGGLVISEYEPNVTACSKTFVSRNRIVAGISMCTIVIEAAYRSGTSITAGLAFSQGRKVFCLPGNVENKYSAGTNDLIKKGANLFTSIDDILGVYPFLEEVKHDQPAVNIPDEYKELYNEITEIAISIDELKQKLNLTIGDLNSKLTMLEIEGYIIELPGGCYIRNES